MLNRSVGILITPAARWPKQRLPYERLMNAASCPIRTFGACHVFATRWMTQPQGAVSCAVGPSPSQPQTSGSFVSPSGPTSLFPHAKNSGVWTTRRRSLRITNQSNSVTRHQNACPKWPNTQNAYHARTTNPLRVAKVSATFCEEPKWHRSPPVRLRVLSPGAVGDLGTRVTRSGNPQHQTDTCRRAKPELRAWFTGLKGSSSPLTDQVTFDLLVPSVGHGTSHANIHRPGRPPGKPAIAHAPVGRRASARVTARHCRTTYVLARRPGRPRAHTESCCGWWSSVGADHHGAHVGSRYFDLAPKHPSWIDMAASRHNSR